MMVKMKIKVKHVLVITSYNNESDVLSLLRDIIKKKHNFKKIYIIDDASTDRFPKLETILKEAIYQNCEFIRSKENFGGPAVSRNKGLDLAIAFGADLVTFIDPDDRLDCNIQEVLGHLTETYADVGMFSFARKTHEGNAMSVPNVDKLVQLKDFTKYNPLILSGLSISLHNLKATKFNEERKNIAVEDYIFYIESLKNGNKILQSNRSKIYYGAAGEHLSRNKISMLIKFARVNYFYFGWHSFLYRICAYIVRGLFGQLDK